MFEWWAKVLSFFGRTPRMMYVQYSNTRRFKREHMSHPSILGGLCSKLNNIKIRTPSFESRAFKELQITRACNPILQLQNTDELEGGVRVKFLFQEFICSHYFCCNPQKRPVPVQTWIFQDQTNVSIFLSIYPSIYRSIHQSIHVLVYLST